MAAGICASASTPVVTLPGSHLYGRLTLGLLNEMELPVQLGDGQRVRADAVLYATGREPNVHGLGLEAAGVAVNLTGIPRTTGSVS